MSETTSVFKPHRGTKTVMDTYNSNMVLENGELFVEGQGSSMGTGKAKIKIGDGTTAYSSLPYAIGDTSTDPITYTNNSSTTVSECLNSISSGVQLNVIIAALRKAVDLLNSNFQAGISTIVSATNSAAGTSLATDASPSTIASTITNMRLASNTVLMYNIYTSTTLKSATAKTVNGSTYDITDWSEFFAVVRQAGSGYGNYPYGGVYIDNTRSGAFISGGAAGLASSIIDVSNNTELFVRAYCQHGNATSSTTYTQGIRAYVFYALL